MNINKKYLHTAVCLLLVCLMFLTACGDNTDVSNVSQSAGNVSADISDTTTDIGKTDDGNSSNVPDNNTSESGTDVNGDNSTGQPDDNQTSSNDNGNDNSQSDSGGNNQNTSSGEVEYSVYAVDGNGDPIANLIVQISGSGYSSMKTTSAKGVAKFTAEKGDYTFSFISPSKDYYYEKSECVLSKTVTSVTVVLLEKAAVTDTVNAFSKKNGEYKKYPAYEISEGMLYAPVEDGEITYFIFVPTRSGTYEVSVSGGSELELGYYGMPIYVQQNSIFEITDNKFELEIHNYNIGTTKDTTSTYVIGVNTVDGKDSDCVLKITRTGDAPWSIEDEPWRVAVADEKYLVKYNGESGKTLTDINVLSSPTVVYNESDGYYHYGSADGPLVLVHIDSAAKYLNASLVDICDTSTFGIYVYNDDGTFAYRERYNELILQYKDICDSNGVCPLNPQLAEIIKAFGEYKGWWKATSAPGYIFGSAPVYKYKDYAWLFCCCYYE